MEFKAPVEHELTDCSEIEYEFDSFESLTPEFCFTGLPQEIIVHVFSNLNKTELLKVNAVSKQTREMATHASLWREIHISEQKDLQEY